MTQKELKVYSSLQEAVDDARPDDEFAFQITSEDVEAIRRSKELDPVSLQIRPYDNAPGDSDG